MSCPERVSPTKSVLSTTWQSDNLRDTIKTALASMEIRECKRDENLGDSGTWIVELIDNLEPDLSGHKHLCLLIETKTAFCMTLPLKTKQCLEFALKLELYLPIMMAGEIITNGDVMYDGPKLKRLLDSYGILHSRRTNPRDQQSNADGRKAREIRILFRSLFENMPAKTRSCWSDRMYFVTRQYNQELSRSRNPLPVPDGLRPNAESVFNRQFWSGFQGVLVTLTPGEENRPTAGPSQGFEPESVKLYRVLEPATRGLVVRCEDVVNGTRRTVDLAQVRPVSGGWLKACLWNEPPASRSLAAPVQNLACVAQHRVVRTAERSANDVEDSDVSKIEQQSELDADNTREKEETGMDLQSEHHEQDLIRNPDILHVGLELEAAAHVEQHSSETEILL